MNKTEFIAAVAEKAQITKKDAGTAVDAVLATLTEQMTKKEDVSFVGFGTFKVNHRDAREGRNPRTKEKIQYPAKDVPVFKPGKALKDAVDGK